MRRSRKPVQRWTVVFRLETARWRSRRTHSSATTTRSNRGFELSPAVFLLDGANAPHECQIVAELVRCVKQ